MTKTIYLLTWFLITAAALILALTDAFYAAAIVTFGLIALGLYGFALWPVAVNRRGSQPESFEQK